MRHSPVGLDAPDTDGRGIRLRCIVIVACIAVDSHW